MKTSWQDEGTDKSVTSPLSLVITGFAPVPDIRQTMTPQLRLDKGDSALILIDLGRGQNRLGASIFAQVYSQVGQSTPDVDSAADLKAFFETVQSLNAQQRLVAYHDRSDGGLFTTVVEMAFAGRCGLDIHLDALNITAEQANAALLNEELGAVVQVLSQDVDAVLAAFAGAGLADCVSVIGRPVAGDAVKISLAGQTLFSGERRLMQRIWTETSYQIQRLRDNAECAEQEFENLLDQEDPAYRPS